jgi:hypothetical protein
VIGSAELAPSHVRVEGGIVDQQGGPPHGV